MPAFEFFRVPHIHFGRGVAARVGELTAALGRTAVVIANGAPAIHQRILEHLTASGVRATLVRQRGEPTVGDVNCALETARANGCDVLVGLGGGSAIDAAKAVAGLLNNGGSALDYMEVVGAGRKITRPAAPWLALPCTAGTGAEVTRNAVIGYPAKQFKTSLRSEHLLPRAVLVDPELGLSVPPQVTAQAGMDALCQLIEAYTSTGAQPMTDVLALEGLGRAAHSLNRVYTNGSDLDAREDMALAALLSGLALTNAGLGAVHGFAAPLGAAFPVPHGAACAALLPHVMAANVAALRAAHPAHPVLERYATIGRILLGQPILASDPAIHDGLAFVRRLGQELQIPPLRQYGLSDKDLPALVALAQKSSSMRYNPMALPEATLQGILQAAL